MIRILLILAALAVGLPSVLVAEDEVETVIVEGTVKAVDAAAGTVAVQPAGKTAVTLTVDESTIITVDGEAAGLADVSVGDVAVAEATSDGTSRVAVTLTVTRTLPVEDPPDIDPPDDME